MIIPIKEGINISDATVSVGIGSLSEKRAPNSPNIPPIKKEKE